MPRGSRALLTLLAAAPLAGAAFGAHVRRSMGASRAELRRAAARAGASLLDAPVVADGRREMLTVLREQAVSVTRHRFGSGVA